MCAAWLIGSATPWLACAFILLNRVVSEALCRLFPMVRSGAGARVRECARPAAQHLMHNGL